MYSTIAALLLAVISVVSSEDSSPSHSQYAKYKSFPSALAECAQYYELSSCTLNRIVQESYPNEPEVRRLIRCTLINLRAWSDTTRVQEQVMNYFFNPTPEDSDFLCRTRECIQRFHQLSGGNSDAQTQAYEAFVCYYRQYGDLNTSDQYLPFADQECEQRIMAALSVTNVSQEGLARFSNGDVLDNPEFPAVLFVMYVGKGFFQRGGVQLEHLYIHYGNSAFLAPQMEQCVDAAVNSLPCTASEQEELYQVFRSCLVDVTFMVEFVKNM